MWAVGALWLWALPVVAQTVDEQRAHVREQMARHFVDAVTMRDAVIAGDLDAVREAAARLRNRLPMQDLPWNTASSERSFVDALLAVEHARDLGAAGRAVGTLVQACAACHTRAGASPSIHPPTHPGTGDGSVAAAMRLHRYGAELMWLGLVVPDPARLQAGAEVFSTSQLSPTGTPVGSRVPPLATELEVRVHDLAASAARTEDPTQQASAYGRMLETCSACHALTGGGPAFDPQGSGPKATSTH